MANGKAEITEIDLSNISVNLSDYLHDIRQYNGFIQCNSPWIGGLLNNVYRKKIVTQDGHKLVRLHHGDIYTLFGSSLYKNYNKVMDISPTCVGKKEYVDPYVVETDTTITVRFAGQTLVIEKLLDYSYDYILSSDEATMYFCSAPTFAVNMTNFKDNTRCYTISNAGVTEETSKYIIISQHKVSFSNLPEAAAYIQYDPAGFISDTSSNIKAIYYNVSEQLITESTDNVCHESGFNYWTRGEKLKTHTGFNTLYYNKYISGISYGNSVITYEVDRIIRVGKDSIIYEAPTGIKYELYLRINTFPQYTCDDEFIYFNTTSYENTYEFNTGLAFCRSDDYNDRLLLLSGTNTSGLWATGYHSNALEHNYKNFATMYPQKAINIGTTYAMFLRDDFVHPIEIFKPVTSGGVAVYEGSLIFTSRATYSLHKNVALVDVPYALDANSNILYNTPLLLQIHDTYINEKIGSFDNGSYILAKSQLQENVLGYYQLTYSEMQNIFLTQGSLYGVNDKFVFSVNIQNSILEDTKAVLNKLDLEFIGAFPQYALFYSKLDKSLYSFTGDATLTKVKECYRINRIYKSYCDPARLTMIIITDMGTLIIYQNQTFLIEDMGTTDAIFYDNNTYIVGNYMISLSYKPEYEILPIKLQTEFYGMGQSIKSVNDCVYIKLTKNNVPKGYLKVKAYTLTEKTTVTNEKTYDLTNDMFDKTTGTIFIRYQPGVQSGSGFSLGLESTNPIASLSISHSPEAIQNTKFNF